MQPFVPQKLVVYFNKLQRIIPGNWQRNLNCELNEHGEIGEDTELEDEQGVTFSIVQKVK